MSDNPGFTEKFDKYAIEGETISCVQDGFRIFARIERDDDTGPPWKHCDGHGPVSEWRPKDSKQPGEKILHEERGSCRFYDWDKALKTAKEDCWDSPPYATGTADERAERAVQRDFEALEAWCEDEWHYCGIVLSVHRNGVEVLEYAASLWGIELNYPNSENGNDYLTEVANELLNEAIVAAIKQVDQMITELSRPQVEE